MVSSKTAHLVTFYPALVLFYDFLAVQVSLARVVYGEEDVVLLDNPLSAVDTKCAAHIFNR